MTSTVPAETESPQSTKDVDSADCFDLTAAQLGIWNAQRIEPDSPYYVVGDVVEVRVEDGPPQPPIAIDALAQAITETVREAESLRLRIIETPDGPRQYISDDEVAPPRIINLADEPNAREAADRAVAKLRDELARHTHTMVNRNLFSCTIIVLSSTEVWYTQLGHHLVFDGYSAAMVSRRVAARYTANVNQTPLPPCPFRSFRDIVADDVAYRASSEHAADREYWLEQLTPFPELTYGDEGVARSQETSTSRAETKGNITPPSTLIARREVGKETVTALTSIAQQAGATWGEALIAAYAAYLYRTLGHSDVVFALPLMCRTTPAQLRTPSMAVNVLPLRIEINGGDNLADVTSRVAEAMRGMRRHQRYRGEDIPQDLSVPGAGALLHGRGINVKAFDLTLNFAGATGVMRNVAGGPPEDYGVSVLPTASGGLLLGCDVDPLQATQHQVDARLAALCTLVEQLAADHQRAVGTVRLIDEATSNAMLAKWTSLSDNPIPLAGTIFERLEQQPDADVLIDSGVAVSARELMSRVHKLARLIRSRDVGADDLVALVMERSTDLIVALLAVWDAGAGYVNVDITYPQSRIADLLSDCAPALVVCSHSASDRVPAALKSQRIVLDAVDTRRALTGLSGEPLGDAELSEPRHPEHAAYVIYTSGSTGTPKGVVGRMGGVMNLLRHHRHTLVEPALTVVGNRQLRCAHTYSFSFDASLDQLLWLLAGHQVHLYSTDTARDVDALITAYRRDRIDVIDTTPSMAAPLIDAGLLGLDYPPSMIIVGGEATPPALWRRLVQSHVVAVNLYGPTEASVDATFSVVNGHRPTIGNPIPGTSILVLDSALQPVAAGDVGELYLAGPHLARGYRNLPATTALRFIANPYGAVGDRMYRTGDRVRYIPGHGLEYVGRTDEQVKVRGYRIELGELEAALLEVPGVGGAVATISRHTLTPRLIGYVTPAANNADDLSGETVRAELSRRLPDHVVPSIVMVVDAIPVTSNGKVDRAALPTPVVNTQGRAARDGTEQKVLDVVCRTLGVQDASIDDDFFSLGGDSISAISVCSELRAAGLAIAPRDFLSGRSLAALAATLKAETDKRPIVVDEPTGPASPTPVMQALFAANPDPSSYAGYVQWSVFTVPDSVDVQRLQRALNALVAAHPALRVTITADDVRSDESGPGTVVIAENAPEVPVTVADCTVEEIGAHKISEIATALASSCDPTRGRNVAAHLIPAELSAAKVDVRNSGTSVDERTLDRVVIAVHHLAVDGVSWQIMLRDLAALYDADLPASGATLTREVTSWRRYTDLLCAEGSSGARQCELEMWKLAEDNIIRLSEQRLDPELDTVATAKVTETFVSREQVAALDAVTDAYRAAADDVILAAFAMTMRAWSNGRIPKNDAAYATVTVEGHGRQPLADDVELGKTVGWFTSEHPLAVPLGPIRSRDAFVDALSGGRALGTLVKSVKEAKKGIPDSGIGYGILKHFDPSASARLTAPAPDIVINYLGEISHPTGSVTGNWRISSQTPLAVVDPKNKALEQVLALNIFRNDDSLRVEWTAAQRLVPDAIVSEIKQHWADALTAMVAHADRVRSDGGGLTPSDVALVTLDQDTIDTLESKRPLKNILPATPLQVGLSYHSLVRERDEFDAYIVQATIHLEGVVDPDTMRAAALDLLRRVPSLTAYLAHTNDEVVQIIPREPQLEFRYRDLTVVDDVESVCDEVHRADKHTEFDLYSGPLIRFTLCRVGQREYRLIFTNHHSLLDGWSMPVVGQTLLAIYGELAGGHPALPVPPSDEYFRWLTQRDLESTRAIWSDMLAGIDSGTFVVAVAAPSTQAPERHTVTLTAEDTAALDAFARASSVTMTTVVHCAWAILLSRLTGDDDVVFGCPVSGRPAEVPGIDRMVGQLGNTIAVRITMDPTEKITTLLERIHRDALAVADHHYLGLTEITRLAGVGDLFDTMVVSENFPMSDRRSQPVTDTLTLAGVDISDATHYPLTLIVIPGDSLTLGISFRPDLIDSDTAQRYGTWLVHIIKNIIDNPQLPLAHLSYLSMHERDRMLQMGKVASTRRRGPVLGELMRWVIEKPSAEAVVCRDRVLTYSQLNSVTDQFATQLIEVGVRPQDAVAVFAERDVDMTVAMISIFKAGAVYVPIDPAYPTERLQYMLVDSAPTAVVTTGKAIDHCCDELFAGLPVLNLATADGALATTAASTTTALTTTGGPSDPKRLLAARAGLTPDALAYIIYTSGTTGTPKGVGVTHRGLPDLIALQEEIVGFTENDRYLQFATTSFDVSIWQMLGPLLSGATSVIAPEEVRVPGDELINYIAKQWVTGINLLPSFLAAMPDDCNIDPSIFMVVGAERLDPAVARRWGRGRRALFNAYGPTEVTVNSVTWRYCEGEQAPIPIGRPDPDVDAYVLDDHLNPVGVGVTGELYLAGPSLARGYLNRPDLTAASFIANPYAGDGSRMYRTGDRVQWRSDGNLIFLGRTDHQIKIRGLRVELGEIESVLGEHDSVRAAAVVVRHISRSRSTDNSEESHKVGVVAQQLVAYVIPADGQTIDARELILWVSARLPEHMVPAAIVALTAFPLTPAGKLDTAALPEVTAPQRTQTRRPSSEAEEVIVSVMAELLGVTELSVDDDFLRMGGDSIVSLQLVSRVRRRGISLTVRDVFEGGTAAGIAARATISAAPAKVRQRTGIVPLTPIMRDLIDRTAGAGLAVPQDFCQWTQLRVPPVTDSRVWEQVVSAIIARHDMVRAVLISSPISSEGDPNLVDDDRTAGCAFALNIREPGCVPVDAVLRIVSPGNDDPNHTDVIEDICATIDLWTGPLLRCVLVDCGPDEPGRLIIVAHHLIVDGVSWRILVDDVHEMYDEVIRGSELSTDAVSMPFYAWARELSGATNARMGELGHWVSRSRQAHSLLDPERDTGATVASQDITLDPNTTRMLLTELPRNFGCGPDAVLLAVLAEAITAVLPETRLISMEGHGRPEQSPKDGAPIDLSRTVGWFTSIYPVALTPGRVTPHAIKAMKDELALAGDTLGYGILADRLPNSSHPEISWNYLGRMRAGTSKDALWAPPAGVDPFGSSADSMPLPHRLMVSAIALTQLSEDDADGDGVSLAVRATWPERHFTVSEIDAFIGSFAAAAHRIAQTVEFSQPAGHSVSDFDCVELDQRTIDHWDDAVEVRDILPLTSLQEVMVHGSRSTPPGMIDPYMVQSTFTFTGHIDPCVMERAAHDLLRRHSGLTAIFPWGSDIQVLSADAHVDFRVIDVDSADERERVLASDMAERFDLTAPSVRISLIRPRSDLADLDHTSQTQNVQERGTGDLVLTTHHALSDGWSAPRMLLQLFELYSLRLAGSEPNVAGAPQIGDYLRWRHSVSSAVAIDAWREELGDGERASGLERFSDIKSDNLDYEPCDPVITRIDSDMVAVLGSHATRWGITLNTLVQGAWSAVLAAQSGSDAIAFGSMVSGRSVDLEGIEDIIGLLANSVPIQMTLADEPLASTLVDAQRRQQALIEHHHVPIRELERVLDRGPLFETMVVFENYPLDPDAVRHIAPGIEIVETRFRDGTELPVTTVVIPDGGGWNVLVASRSGLYPRSVIEVLSAQLMAALLEFTDPDTYLRSGSELRDRISQFG